MVDSVLSGYKAAAQAVVFSGTQQIDSALDNEWTNLSDEIDNSLNKYMMMDLELVLGSAVFISTSVMEIYLIPSIDDTNYPLWVGDATADQQENNQYFIGSVTLSDATEAQRVSLRSVAMVAGKFKFGIRSRAGVTLNATGNTLKWRPWQYSSQ